ncbi:hypothetical protein [Pseudooceanicola aestuarii]|uniref:hypothetical protein n=1 Tax=Pseudooceanicola aestuarii TaxID=2697319 RepID=UPI001EF8C739|nr:hypothetical protein [Pseudooceanicola aestuarii]
MAPPRRPGSPKGLRRGWRGRLARFQVRARRTLPPVVRSVLGLLLILGGLFGFLPILGFWMLPLGLALVALDLRGLRNWRQPPHPPRQG